VAFLSLADLAAAQSPPQASTTIRANTNLVVVDVVVTDSKQSPVHHLAASDFLLFEDGHPQAIKTFEEHSTAEAPALPPTPKLDPGVFTNQTPAPQNGPLDIVLLDRLNTPMKDQPFVMDELLKYLKGVETNHRIAIFGLNGQLVLLQGFTSDAGLLRAALQSRKGGPRASAMMDQPGSGSGPGTNDLMMENAEEAAGMSAADAVQALRQPAATGKDKPPPSALAQEVANLAQFEAEQQAFQLEVRTKLTLDALNQLGRYLGRFPGRKNLIWFSASFPINVLPDENLLYPFRVSSSVEREFRETVDGLAKSQVAVYPIDARGLMNAPMIDASNSGRRYATSPSAYARDQATFLRQTSNEHGTMQQMAESTGGRAFVNTNGLTQAVGKAVEAGSNYYTLTYSPTNHLWNGAYRKIVVKVSSGGVNLAYRRGYYADDLSAPARSHSDQSEASAPAPYNAMHTAMLQGGPESTEILFVASVRPTTADAESPLAPGNLLESKFKGPFKNFTVNFVASMRDIDCPATPDHVFHCAVEFVTRVYAADGDLVNVVSNGIKAKIPPSKYASMQHGGIQFTQEVSVPAKGESFLRMGVHDMTADRVGVLEVPVSAVSALPPLPPEKATPAPASTPK